MNHGETIRRDRLEAVTALARAASDHRRTMWMRGDAVLKGSGAELIQSLRRENHQTRSQVTRPLVAMRVLITDPAVRTAADRMITLTYAIRDHFGSTEELTAAREAAMVAHDQFCGHRRLLPRPARLTAPPPCSPGGQPRMSSLSGTHSTGTFPRPPRP
ncbi:hypothetical protein [Streptomyces sp. NPDC059513]|uniref:hypothetical protein n=1 Tax=unclassified Streptomyces TaxID=2593676 RepID=UPI0036CF8075